MAAASAVPATPFAQPPAGGAGGGETPNQFAADAPDLASRSSHYAAHGASAAAAAGAPATGRPPLPPGPRGFSGRLGSFVLGERLRCWLPQDQLALQCIHGAGLVTATPQRTSCTVRPPPHTHRHTSPPPADRSEGGSGAWHDGLLPLSPSLDSFLGLGEAAGSGCLEFRPARLPSRLLRWARRRAATLRWRLGDRAPLFCGPCGSPRLPAAHPRACPAASARGASCRR